MRLIAAHPAMQKLFPVKNKLPQLAFATRRGKDD